MNLKQNDSGSDTIIVGGREYHASIHVILETQDLGPREQGLEITKNLNSPKVRPHLYLTCRVLVPS
jgi:hypothetical protein